MTGDPLRHGIPVILLDFGLQLVPHSLEMLSFMLSRPLHVVSMTLLGPIFGVDSAAKNAGGLIRICVLILVKQPFQGVIC